MRSGIFGVLCMTIWSPAAGQTIQKIQAKDTFVIHSTDARGNLVWADFKSEAQKEADKFCGRMGKRVVSPEIARVDPSDLEDSTDQIIFRCAAMASTPPTSAPFGDAKYYVIAAPVKYKLGKNKLPVVVPRGFVTDLASVPRVFWTALPRDGKYLSAAILHDYMYWDQRCTREEADLVLKLNMEDFGVSGFDRVAVYQAVKKGGAGSWNENARTKATRIRVIPEPHLTNFLESDLDASRTWDTIHSELRAAGITPKPDAENQQISLTCQRVVTETEK